MMIWRKPDNLKYVDLCIYIDEHAPEIVNAGENPHTEDLIYNYIWLVVKALAIKKRMFDSFDDYDGYSIYAANRLFFALRKSYLNEGKTIKGKTIKPIKSILNYMKTLMYPMKLEYINEQYNSDIKSMIAAKKFDEFSVKQQFKEEVWSQQGGQYEFKQNVIGLFENFNETIDKVLEKSPFNVKSVDYKKLRISILLNCLQNLKAGKGLNAEPLTATVWKLPKSMNTYVRLFIKELGTQLKCEIMTSYSDTQVDDKILDYMISNPDGEFINNED